MRQMRRPGGVEAQLLCRDDRADDCECEIDVPLLYSACMLTQQSEPRRKPSLPRALLRQTDEHPNMLAPVSVQAA